MVRFLLRYILFDKSVLQGPVLANNDVFTILCPSQGEITYDESELDKVWKPRSYQFFEVKVPNKKIIVDPNTGQINLRYNPATPEEDYYLYIRHEDTEGDT